MKTYKVFKKQTGEIFFERYDQEGNVVTSKKLQNQELESYQMKDLENKLNETAEQIHQRNSRAESMGVRERG